LYRRATDSIRTVDKNHIILLGGPQWNSNFEPFADWTFDDNIMYTCHRYGGDATAEAIASYIAFRDSTNLPMYMGEIGHNTDEWQSAFCDVLEQNNIGYTFWPYKKVDGSCMMGITRPAGWDSLVVAFAEAPRCSYSDIRAARPDRKAAREALDAFVEASRFENCTPQKGYIRSIKLNPDNN
ncbi:MAG: glycoside hydrolase family 5 protein, partial [Muribaculaceae bacterium]|nr:glycoside hydrolase family 5 protein [Muribaculaceae bacterium]